MWLSCEAHRTVGGSHMVLHRPWAKTDMIGFGAELLDAWAVLYFCSSTRSLSCFHALITVL